MYNSDRMEFEVSEYKDKKKKDSKLSIVIWGIVVLITIVLSIYFMSKESTDNRYIILDNSGVIEYKDGIYKEAQNDDYLKSNYKVFYQRDYIGSYFISKIDDFTKEVFFTNVSSEETYVFNKPLLALSDNIEMIEYPNENFTENDFDIFYNISSKDYIVKKSDILDSSKVSLDFDKDGSVETFYTVTYEYTDYDGEDIEISDYNYSVFYYVKNDYTYLICESEPYKEEESIVFPSYLIRAVVDINNDGYYELIVTNRMYDIPIYEIYEYKDGEYVSMFTTSIGGNYEE